MASLGLALDENRSAVDALIAAAWEAEDRWLTPRAPGKWSPSQVVEHVSRALEESSNEVAGRPSKFPTLPVFLRPLLRAFFFNGVVKTGTFRKAKTNSAMDPEHGPATPAEGQKRLEDARAEFERACEARKDPSPVVRSGAFGTVRLQDYVRFQAFHTRHHTAQMKP